MCPVRSIIEVTVQLKMQENRLVRFGHQGQFCVGVGNHPEVVATPEIVALRVAAARLVNSDETGINFVAPGPVSARVLQLIEQKCLLAGQRVLRRVLRGETDEALLRSLRFWDGLRMEWWAWRMEWEVPLGIWPSPTGLTSKEQLKLFRRELAVCPCRDINFQWLRENSEALGGWPRSFYNLFDEGTQPGFLPFPAELPEGQNVPIVFFDRTAFFGATEYADLLRLLGSQK